MRALVVLVFVVVSARASAEPRFGIAVNNPLMWGDHPSIAASFYGRVTAHQVVRLNVASYRFRNSAEHPFGVIDDVLGEADPWYTDAGVRDLSAAWMYFPRKAFDGPTLEAGALFRSVKYTQHTEANDNFSERDAREYAGRALVGWSWLMYDRMFIALAAGGSYGYTTGRQTESMDYVQHPMTTTHDVREWSAGFEGYLRFGVAF